MNTYTIYNDATGVKLGTYMARTPFEALDACARDAGYSSYSASLQIYADLDDQRHVAHFVRIRDESSGEIYTADDALAQ